MAARKSPSRKKSSSSKKSSSRRQSAPRDALALLRADHQTVQALFDKYEKTRAEDRKSAIAEQICNELSVHAQIEEEIFYPAIRKEIRDEDLIDEATVEHQSAKDLIAQIEAGDPGDVLFDAKVKVLGEYVKHHVREEQNELFPQVRKTKLDLKEIGERLMARKQELMAGGGKRGSGGGMAGSRQGTGRSKRGGQSRKETADESGAGIMTRMARGMGLA
ncbi:MAG: hemerythrin domain-containing protein [Burkholderiales bacterium]